jgi:mRNA interferase RelE/StbE
MSSSYTLKFIPTALKEWEKVDRPVQLQFKKKLAERLENPHVPASQLYGFPNHYKIKLRATGYRLVYEVQDKQVCVLVIAVGKRDKLDVYRKARKRREGPSEGPR